MHLQTVKSPINLGTLLHLWGVWGHSYLLYLLFCVVYWSRQPRVIWHLSSLLFVVAMYFSSGINHFIYRIPICMKYWKLVIPSSLKPLWKLYSIFLQLCMHYEQFATSIFCTCHNRPVVIRCTYICISMCQHIYATKMYINSAANSIAMSKVDKFQYLQKQIRRN